MQALIDNQAIRQILEAFPLATAASGLNVSLCCPSRRPHRRMPRRPNPWGRLTYADMIVLALISSEQKRMKLRQIYGWIISNIPYFYERSEGPSSRQWKNSIRHNLSLHDRFIRMKDRTPGENSWWALNPNTVTMDDVRAIETVYENFKAEMKPALERSADPQNISAIQNQENIPPPNVQPNQSLPFYGLGLTPFFYPTSYNIDLSALANMQGIPPGVPAYYAQPAFPQNLMNGMHFTNYPQFVQNSFSANSQFFDNSQFTQSPQFNQEVQFGPKTHFNPNSQYNESVQFVPDQQFVRIPPLISEVKVSPDADAQKVADPGFNHDDQLIVEPQFNKDSQIFVPSNRSLAPSHEEATIEEPDAKRTKIEEDLKELRHCEVESSDYKAKTKE